MSNQLKPTKTGRITWERFQRDFPLVRNHLDSNASFDGCMFETYGKELEFVQMMRGQGKVLTVLDCDGKTIIQSGWHFVNRIGYLITKSPVQFDFWLRD
jgi:hypothetical protein